MFMLAPVKLPRPRGPAYPSFPRPRPGGPIALRSFLLSTHPSCSKRKPLGTLPQGTSLQGRQALPGRVGGGTGASLAQQPSILPRPPWGPESGQLYSKVSELPRPRFPLQPGVRQLVRASQDTCLESQPRGKASSAVVPGEEGQGSPQVAPIMAGGKGTNKGSFLELARLPHTPSPGPLVQAS